ncbi:lipopolysaccharide kinase InaA family protein [Stutzerimonas xanthomarina]|uniref:Lipopolysaccharide kinase (Kdo/WaaP) family protein n=2 Tax=Stutzerimonas xanthomarina TaxID=271420 RepID=A0A1M5KNY1_9GAMM|nr:lipopolysaccharide kinase InaA family protein [Stutzerimonas xanthomarina]MCP9337219.1 heptose kinase [Stutzerimonas xanthomarina]SEI07439.1 Lipopolysaccharide kinase (Kdo/WaaP) family protein [Stutzerimonas xanthomarina]SHG54380.1 Lipopolysaccharide kinase (Kdo/WaaP) family protein [Stutzerimonas xanthomarina DSM 18231]
MSAWTVVRGADPEAVEAFASLESVFALRGEPIARDPLSEVIRVERDGLRYYVKRYWAAGKGLRRYLGRPRVKAEWQNLKHFERWGIPVAPLVAWGMERRAGAFVRGALITLEVPNSVDMAAIATNADPRLSDRHWVEQISRQVAQATRTLHDHRFAHNDLKWRNLLVNDAGELFMIDCPSGDFWWGPFLRHRIVKDLACLDKVAKQRLSRTQRLRFYLQYQQRPRLVPGDRAVIGQVLKYFEGRE